MNESLESPRSSPSPNPPQWITANALYNHTKCLHRVYLDANGDPEDKTEVSRFARLLWELGLQTERDYLERLEGGPVTDLSGYAPETAWKSTLEAMKRGDGLIYQGCLVHDRYRGRPDLLIRHDDGSSAWGSYYYEPVDIKAGRGWEERDGQPVRFKKHYAYQMIFYRDLLQAIQGTVPTTARIINVEMEPESFDPARFEESYRSARREVELLVDGRETSEPVLGSHCQQCEWYRRCKRWVVEKQDPTGVFFVGKVKFNLKEVGLRTISDLARMDVEKFAKPPFRIPRMGKKTLARIKERAAVVLRGRPEIRTGYSFPEAATEVHFDIEDDPTRGVTYLFGFLEIRENVKPVYRYFLARKPDEEEAAVRAFWDYLRDVSDPAVYVYSHKERTSLRKLMEKYRLDPAVFEKYLKAEYDIYQKLIVEHSDWPTFSYGIKFIADQIGFRWRDPDPSGVNSIVWYNDYLADSSREDLMNRILQYNEDDCRAMVALKDYFVRASANQGPDAASSTQIHSKGD